MQVIFESRDPQGAQLRTATLRRVRLAMRKLKWLAPHVKVHLSDVDGRSGGIDKRCQVELSTPGNDTVVVTSMARDWLSALQSSLARATKSLLHKAQPRIGKSRGHSAAPSGPPRLTTKFT
jgi:hypothetical protein